MEKRFVCKSDYWSLEKSFLTRCFIQPIRIKLTIQLYEFEIKYIPGKKVASADAKSIVNPQDKMEQKGLDFTIHEVAQCMAVI